MIQCVNDISLVRSSNARKSCMETWTMQNLLWKGKFARQVSSSFFFLVFCFVCNWIWKNSVELLLLLLMLFLSNRCCLLFFVVLTFRILLAILHIESLKYYSYSYIIRLRLRWFLVVLFTLWCCCSCVFLGDLFRKCLWYPYPCWAQPTACPLARTPRAPRSWVSGACLSSRDRSEMGI